MDPDARRPLASTMLALRSLDWLMIADDAARPRCVAASKHTVSNAPRMMPAVTGSTVAEVGSGSRLAASRLFNSNDMAVLLSLSVHRCARQPVHIVDSCVRARPMVASAGKIGLQRRLEGDH